LPENVTFGSIKVDSNAASDRRPARRDRAKGMIHEYRLVA
jgi:hypothetical protein